MNYTRETLKNGLMHFATGLRGPESLLSVRYLPNRRIDLLSINEMARLNANMAFQMRNVDFGDMPSDEKGTVNGQEA